MDEDARHRHALGSGLGLGLLLAACGPGGAMAEGSEATQGDSDSEGDSAAETGMPPYNESLEEQLRPLCEEVCAAHEQGPSPCVECSYDTVASCVLRCLAAIEDTDLTCGTCVIEQIEWEEPTCFEGGDFVDCQGGVARFGLVSEESPCADACADVLDGQAPDPGPVPDPIGHLPELEYGDAELEAFERIAAAPDADFGLVVASERGLHGFDLQLTPSWTGGPEVAARALVVGETAGASVGVWGVDDAGTLIAHGPDAAMLWTQSFTPSGLSDALLHPSALGLLVHADEQLQVYDADGSFLASGAPPEGDAVRVVAGDGADGIALLRAAGELYTVERYGLTRAGEVVEFTLQSSFEVGLADDEQELSLWHLGLSPGGELALGGSQYVVNYPAGGGSISHSTTWVGVYESDGTPRFGWRPPPPRIVNGQVDALVFDPSGTRVAVVASEDPALDDVGATEPLCSPTGCLGLAVHVFSLEGHAWSYERRQIYSFARALSWTHTGELIVAGGDSGGAVLLRFVPPA